MCSINFFEPLKPGFLLTKVFSFEKHSSIGLKSGGYEGNKHMWWLEFLRSSFTTGDVWMEALSITKKWGSALVWSSFFMIPLIKSLKISLVVLWDKVGYQTYGSKWITLIFDWLSISFCGLVGHRRSNHPQWLYNIRRIRTVSEPNIDYPHCNNHISASTTSLLPLT